MKLTPYTAWVLLALSFLFSIPAFSQNAIATDSLTVEWEQLDGPPGAVFKYAESDGLMFAGTDAGLYSSSNGGKSWKFNNSLGIRRLVNYCVKGAAIFALVQENTFDPVPIGVYSFSKDRFIIFRSLDHGVTWAQSFDSELTNMQIGFGARPELFITNDLVISFIFHSTLPVSSRCWQSFDGGNTWQLLMNSFKRLYHISVIGDTVAGIQDMAGSYQLAGFLAVNSQFGNAQSVDFASLPDFSDKKSFATFKNGKFCVILENRSIYQTSDLGATWTTGTLPVADTIHNVIYANGTNFLITSDGVWRGDFDAPFSFEKVYNGEEGITKMANTFFATSAGYWVNSNARSTLFSPDNGHTWESSSNGLVSKVNFVNSYCGKLVAFYQEPYSGAGYSTQHSNPQDGAWKAAGELNYRRILGEANGIMYAYPPVMRSFDCAATWDTIQYPQINIQAAPNNLIQDKNRVYLWNKSGAPIQFSDDNGNNWLDIPTPELWAECKAFIPNGDTLLFLSATFGPTVLYRSVNFGQTWETIPVNSDIDIIYPGDHGEIIGIESNHLSQADTSMADIFVSDDLGNNWVQTFSTNQEYPYSPVLGLPSVRFPLVQDGLILMHASGGVFVSHNAGIHWTRLSNLPFFNYTLGAYATREGFTEGASYYNIDEDYLYAATECQGIWRTPFSPIRDHTKVKSNEYGILKGRLFLDSDSDCLYNLAAGDKPLGQKPVLINPGNIHTNTDANGLYNIALPIGNYTVTATAPTYYTTVCANDTIAAAISLGNTESANLPYSPVAGIRDLCVLITTPFAARPGFDVTYKMQVYNIGTTTIAGAIATFLFDQQWLIPIAVSHSGQFSGNKAIISLPNIAPGEAIIITLSFNVLANTPLGTSLDFTAACPVPEDANPANNTTRITQTVQGSFDPNDKNALPIIPQPPGQPRLLDYLIRFQNTGTDTAFTVVVTDTLEAGLNLLTLRTLEASHDFEYTMLPGRIVKWRFRNILLPDSNTNELASHGYLRFQIETNAGLIPGTPIRNDADIFFDFNSPVRTNEATSDNPKWVVTDVSNVVLCAGDTWNGSTYKTSETLLDTVGNSWSDTITVVNLEVLPTWALHIDTTVSLGAVLLNNLILHDTTFALNFSSSDGCDSTVIWNVTVQTSSLPDIDNAAVQFELRPNPATQETWLVVTESAKVNISIFNTSGTLLQTWNQAFASSSAPFSLGISALPPGLYFVQIQTEKSQAMKRLVKL